MVCNNCGNKYPIDGLGTENKNPGGCWPGYLPSTVSDGTPGVGNSVALSNIAPLILDVSHYPIIPHSTDTVLVTAKIIDELTSGITTTLYYREDVPYGQPANSFTSLTMYDDGLHGDGDASDGIYGVQIPIKDNDVRFKSQCPADPRMGAGP